MMPIGASLEMQIAAPERQILSRTTAVRERVKLPRPTLHDPDAAEASLWQLTT